MIAKILMFVLGLVLAAPVEAAEVPRPEDGSKNYVTVFGSVSDAKLAEAKALDPSAHFRVISESDPVADHYRPYVGEFPAVVVQSPSGKVLYKRSGANFIEGSCPLKRPLKRPSPAPVEPPTIEPVPPSVVPDTVVPDTQPSFLVYAGLALLGAGAGIYSKARDEFRRS